MEDVLTAQRQIKTQIPIELCILVIGLSLGLAQRQITTQIPIELCILVIGLSLGLGLGLSHCQSDRAIRGARAGEN